MGFVGLGNMGGPMALNLLKAGYEVIAFDLSAPAIAVVEKAGAKVCSFFRSLLELSFCALARSTRLV